MVSVENSDGIAVGHAHYRANQGFRAGSDACQQQKRECQMSSLHCSFFSFLAVISSRTGSLRFHS
jgi:hypothetical protein